MFVLISFQTWDKISTGEGEYLDVDREADPTQPVGFLPVFETRAAAEHWSQGRFEVVELEFHGASRN